MIQLFAKRFIRNYENVSDPAVRRGYGVLCGVAGIVLNLLLFLFKLLAGFLSGSIAIMADAANNLSDAGSSVVTLLGFKLAAQKPDKAHPFGHGRIEYISGLVVSMVIVLMGFELAQSSIQKIRNPEPVQFSVVVLVILAVSILVKLYMAAYNRSIGKKIDSAAMAATAADSLSDSLATGAVLIATVVGKVCHIQIDGWCGVVVSLFILWAGISAAKETMDPLLGQPPTKEFVEDIRRIVMSHSEIIGIHDLIVHNYGPGRCILSLHAEVPAEGDILVLHDVIDLAEHELQEQLSCLATIHMDPVVRSGITEETRARVETMVKAIHPSLSIHDFRMVPGTTHTNLIFDTVVPFDCPIAPDDVRSRIEAGAKALDPTFFAVTEIDSSYI